MRSNAAAVAATRKILDERFAERVAALEDSLAFGFPIEYALDAADWANATAAARTYYRRGRALPRPLLCAAAREWADATRRRCAS